MHRFSGLYKVSLGGQISLTIDLVLIVRFRGPEDGGSRPRDTHYSSPEECVNADKFSLAACDISLQYFSGKLVKTTTFTRISFPFRCLCRRIIDVPRVL